MPISSPSTQLYQLGKGILYIGPWTGATPPTYPTDYVDVGNCPKFDVEVSEEKLDHYSSRSGVRVKDKTVTLEVGYTVAFELDEVSFANMTRYFRGTAVGDTIRALTNMDAEHALYFISDNPVGDNEKWKFWRVKLTPGAAFTLLSEEWNKMAFSGEGLADTANHSSSPYFDVQWVTTTSA